MWPVAGTGNLLTKNAAGIDKPMIKESPDGKPTIASLYGPETFFDFWYSLNPDATAEDNKDNSWKSFNEAQPENKGYAPNKLTKSMRASIKAGMANHLLDGQTYKITMTIKRLDSKTGYVTINSYDIDITKDMPTGMPKAFGIKSKQLTDGNIKFFVRPYAGVDFEYEGGTNAPATTDPWIITWKDFVINPANADNFKKLFNADKYVDINGDEKTIELHNYRWAMDTRMYNLEGIFDGIYVDELDADGNKTGKKTIDKNYILQFNGVGSYAGALSAQAKDGVVKADADNADGNALSVFNEKYDITIVNPDQLAHKKGAYTLPLIHWSHLGETKTVSAGYIYRDISATLNEKGDKFLVPADTKAGKAGLSITNDDYEIAIQPIMTKVNNNDVQLTATYICALNQAITFENVTTANAPKTFAYNKDISVAATEAKFKLSSEIWQNGSTTQAYFNTKFDASWKTNSAGTLKEWIAKPWCWIDVNSLKVVPTGWNRESYYDPATFMVNDKVFDPKTNKFSEITSIAMMRSATSQGLNDLKEDLPGYFTFDIYDIWFHKKSVVIYFKVTHPDHEGTINARQAK